ncbi:MAG: response regulator transcription factor, partial [Acidimicrobiia bacterium]
GRASIFLVEDHPLTLFGLQKHLEDRYDLVGSASEAGAAIAMILERSPDLVLLDVQFPGGGGATVVEAVKAKNPEIKFLAFTVSTSARDVVGLFKAGVDGYVVKTTEGFELDERIDEALAGGRPVSRYVAGHLLEIDDLAAADSELETLTPREREVVTLIARGYKYREVADELGISQKTLESHMRHVFDKLGVASRSEVTRLAFETGFVSPGDAI